MQSCFVSSTHPEVADDDILFPEIGLRDGVLQEVWCSACDLNAECLEAREMEASVDAFEAWLLDFDDAEREALAALE